jgi:hypothetical protein
MAEEMSDAERFKSWQDDFHLLRQDVHRLFVRREIFKALVEELARTTPGSG